MRSVFFPRLVNGPFGDPALYVRVAHRGEALLFDCGDLRQLTPRELLKIRAVFISHGHIDHLIGFDSLLRQFLYQDRELVVCGPPGFCDLIAARLGGYAWNLLEGYPLRLSVREWGDSIGRSATFRASEAFRAPPFRAWPCPEGILFDAGHWRVRALPLDHGGLTSLAFSLEEPLHVAIHKEALQREGLQPGPWLSEFKDRLRAGTDLTAPCLAPLCAGGSQASPFIELARRIAHVERGMKLCYVTDASPTPENLARIEELAGEADLLAIEAPFAHVELDRARTRAHLTAWLAGNTARRAGVTRLLPFHHSPRYLDRPELLAQEARQAFAGIEH